MAESTKELQRRLQVAVASGFRDRLLDKGLARGLIWRNGRLPAGSPSFPDGLTEDLLDYGYAVMAMALRLRTQASETPALEHAFLVAGEAIEAAVHRGDHARDRGFHRVSAAIAFHLARYAVRAYSILPSGTDTDNLAPVEQALVQLMRRNLDEMYNSFSGWLLDSQHEDRRIAARLCDDEEFDEVDAADTIITTSFMRGLALFDHGITTGESESMTRAMRQLESTAEAARELNAISHWGTVTLASHLIDALWKLSLHTQIPILPPDDDDSVRWNDLRRSYIQRLRAGKRSAIELWPSQIEAVKRAMDPSDDLVVALPTGAGKTRIAEFCILRALAAQQRIVYVTPLRALSAQVERDLAETFLPLGFTVSALYGSAGIQRSDAETLSEGKIVVSTPEKLDFALRNDPSIIDDVGLIVLDEGHMLGPNEREVRYEALVQRLLRRRDAADRRIVCLSALFPTPNEMRELVEWIRQDEPGGPVHSTWRPTRQRFGVVQWLSHAARLDVKVEGESPFVPRFVETRDPPEGSRRRKTFPSNKNELTLATAWRFIDQEKEVLVYCPLRKSVEPLGRLVLKCIEHGVIAPLREVTPRIQNAMATGAEWLGGDHPAVQCLQYGVALHHGGLPRPFLNEIEKLLRSGDCPITIASPTLAQGLNLSASVLLVPSIWRNREIIPATEFANVAGRAGRAFVDVEGLVLHIVWEDTAEQVNWAIRNWEQLVAAARAPHIVSGLLLLAWKIYKRISVTAGVPLVDVVEYVTGHAEAWGVYQPSAGNVEVAAAEWERDVASLDSAILALLDAETTESSLEPALDGVL
ncbi:MAG TPA: DEAD/DEAH box helicase, partial [Bacteroidetes bacterium]|nr:DEAD/DEAH box helicase [Bacteroidota bacterium]